MILFLQIVKAHYYEIQMRHLIWNIFMVDEW